MGAPLKKITPELVQEHPALKEFYHFIRHNGQESVDFKHFTILNPKPNDGQLGFNYIPQTSFKSGEKAPIYSARLDATHKTILLRHGWITPQGSNPNDRDFSWKFTWKDEPILKVVDGTCHSLKTIGGSEEAKFICQDTPATQAISHGQKLKGIASTLIGVYFPVEFWGTVGAKAMGKKAFPLTRFLFGIHTPEGGQSLSLALRMQQIMPGLFAGGAGMALFYGVGNLMNLDPALQRHERFSMGVLGAYGAQRLYSKYRGGKVKKLGVGLISAALVDATFGPLFGKEGSFGREFSRGAAFFLPEIYRGLMGSRSMAISHRRGVAAGGRWLGRIAVAGFVADLGYMGYNYISEGSEGSARNNRLYARAQELQSQNEGTSLWKGALGLVAPSLVERYTVKDRYVKLAKQEIEDQTKGISQNATNYLRYSLIQGDAGQNRQIEFYQKVDLSWLRSSNELGIVTRPDGTRLPVDSVAEQLSDPKIYQRQIENSSSEAILTYIQNQFSGWDLSPTDVQEILGRISLHQIRSEIKVLKQLDPKAEGIAAYFDSKGNLKKESETKLLQHVLADLGQAQGEELTEDQILALRKVGLVANIRQLQEVLKAAEHSTNGLSKQNNIRLIQKDLELYRGLAHKLGLMDGQGNFILDEITQHGLRLPIAQAPASPNQPASQGAIFLKIMDQYPQEEGSQG